MKLPITTTTILLTAVFALSGTIAQAAPKALKLEAACEQNVVNTVFDKLGRYDETFSVFGYKIIYEGFFTKLVVVRTSDEVEPRDVLVEIVTDSTKSCEVTFKDTLADGSVSDIDDELIELKQNPENLKGRHFLASGTVLTVTTGEIDPHVIGDVCLIELQLADGSVLGLLTEQWQCDDSKTLKQGAKLNANVHKNDLVTKPEELSVLKQMFKAARFYHIPFNEIK